MPSAPSQSTPPATPVPRPRGERARWRRLAGELGLLVASLVSCLACTAPRATAVQGEAGAAAPVVPRQSLAVTFENDLFTGSDNNYSNGFGVTWQSAEYRDYAPESFQHTWVEFWSFLPRIGDENCQVFAAWTLGQETFTPDDISLAQPPPDDQPYAGVLFLDSTLTARTDLVTHAWNLRVGVVGPAAMAEQAQNTAHEFMGVPKARGWDSQLPNEPLLNVDYTVGYDWLTSQVTDTSRARLVPMAGASLGNYFTGASAAVYGEFGWNLPDSIGLLSIRRGLDPFVDVGSQDTRPWTFSLYLGAGGFAVGHYLPLDGTLLSESPSVDSEPLVGFFSTGLTLRRERWTVGYLLTRFTDTFETQRQDTDYGTLSIAWTY